MSHPVPCLAMPWRGMQHHAVLDQAMPCGTMPNHAAMAMPGRTKLYCAGPCYPMLSWQRRMDHSCGHSMDGNAVAVLCQGIPCWPCWTKLGWTMLSHPIVSLLDQTTACTTMPPHAFVAILDHTPPYCSGYATQDQAMPCQSMLLHLCWAESCHAGLCQPTLLVPTPGRITPCWTMPPHAATMAMVNCAGLRPC